MGNHILSCLLAVITIPIFAGKVSSTSVLTISGNSDSENEVSTKIPPLATTHISFLETLGIRNSLVKVPSVAITPQVSSDSLLVSKINHAIDSVSPISGNIQINTTVSVQENLQQETNIESPVTSQFPKFSRSSILSETLNNSNLVNPAPEKERIASVFGWRIRPFSGSLQMHNGIDYGAPLGTPVVAARDGIVTKVVSGCLDFSQRSCGDQFGNWIEIDHGNGMVATYAHLLNNSITVEEGTKVWQNQEIAQVGSSGWSTGAHLDFRIKVNGEFKNPAHYVKN